MRSIRSSLASAAVAVVLAGCSRPAPDPAVGDAAKLVDPPAPAATTTSDRDSHPVPPTEAALPESHRRGVGAVTAYLRGIGEDPADYLCEPAIDVMRKQLVYHLWHRSAFLPENRGTIGNPGGKCRDVIYDPDKQKVIESLLWQ